MPGTQVMQQERSGSRHRAGCSDRCHSRRSKRRRSSRPGGSVQLGLTASRSLQSHRLVPAFGRPELCRWHRARIPRLDYRDRRGGQCAGNVLRRRGPCPNSRLGRPNLGSRGLTTRARWAPRPRRCRGTPIGLYTRSYPRRDRLAHPYQRPPPDYRCRQQHGARDMRIGDLQFPVRAEGCHVKGSDRIADDNNRVGITAEQVNILAHPGGRRCDILCARRPIMSRRASVAHGDADHAVARRKAYCLLPHLPID